MTSSVLPVTGRSQIATKGGGRKIAPSRPHRPQALRDEVRRQAAAPAEVELAALGERAEQRAVAAEAPAAAEVEHGEPGRGRRAGRFPRPLASRAVRLGGTSSVRSPVQPFTVDNGHPFRHGKAVGYKKRQ